MIAADGPVSLVPRRPLRRQRNKAPGGIGSQLRMMHVITPDRLRSIALWPHDGGITVLDLAQLSRYGA
jgi:hypothetical protein